MNMNVKTMTVEELKGQKKSIHLSGFQYMLGEIRSNLRQVAAYGNADLRLQSEMSRSQCTTPVQALVESIVYQCHTVFLRHCNLDSDQYADDESFSALLGEMKSAKAHARSKFRLWLEDSNQILTTVCDVPLLHAHRALIAFLERRVASEPPEQRAATALELCKLSSLLVTSVGETNELSRTGRKSIDPGSCQRQGGPWCGRAACTGWRGPGSNRSQWKYSSRGCCLAGRRGSAACARGGRS